LSVFDQANQTKDHHILNVNENDFPEKYRPLIRRLKKAASNPEVKKQMQDEDEVWRYMRDYERKGEIKGEAKGLAEGRAEGLVEGEAIGAAKTLEQSVLNANRKGLPLETISIFTGLTPEQITEILKRHGL